VAKAPKGTTDHLIDEAARRLEFCDARCQALPDAEVRRLPRHLVARPEQTGGDATNGPLARGRRRALMELDITSQVETQRRWRCDPRPEDDDRHGGSLAGRRKRQFPAAYLDERGEQRIEVGIGARLRLIVVIAG